jgi:hypothetical protein
MEFIYKEDSSMVIYVNVKNCKKKEPFGSFPYFSNFRIAWWREIFPFNQDS